MAAWLDADWPAPPGVRALTTLRHGAGVSRPPFDAFNLGSRCGDDPAAVAENRRQLEVGLALPSSPRWLRQVHGVDVVRFPPSLSRSEGEGRGGVLLSPAPAEATPSQPPPSLRERGGGEPEADAAVTSTPGIVLAILTADCLPVVFAAKDGVEIAVAHAGWRGLAGGVLEATMASMRTPAGELVAWLGPGAGFDAYEVGDEVRDAFAGAGSHAASIAFFRPTRPGHWLVDLQGLARWRLIEAGMPAPSIHGGDLCTISDPARFFSHRRDSRGGRIATLAWIAP